MGLRNTKQNYEHNTSPISQLVSLHFLIYTTGTVSITQKQSNKVKKYYSFVHYMLSAVKFTITDFLWHVIYLNSYENNIFSGPDAIALYCMN